MQRLARLLIGVELSHIYKKGDRAREGRFSWNRHSGETPDHLNSTQPLNDSIFNLAKYLSTL